MNPDGGSFGAEFESANHVVFAHVPLTRTYAGPSADASLRSLGFVRSIGGRYSYSSGFMPDGVSRDAPCTARGAFLSAASSPGPYGLQNLPPVTSSISTL